MPQQKLDWNLQNTYTSLPEKFFRKIEPTPVADPRLVLWNRPLANGLDLVDLNNSHSSSNSQQFDTVIHQKISSEQSQELASIFSGNKIPEGARPIAQSYAGHQFGHFTMLGDGRAILLGEQVTSNESRFDIQLKGAGLTPFSRGGDGRATLYSMLREYLISEAMFYLNIPTTRSLAVVATGEKVYREEIQEGAVLTRVAASHIRVGTFEFAYHFLTPEESKELASYTINRHYPEANHSSNPMLTFFQTVMERQLDLILHWMRVGFIHGVMNTDNMSIAGETIDYGPCAFMNSYDPKTVFSSIDRQGRYAFGSQPAIAQWNLACFANAILPLLHTNNDEAIELARSVLDSYADSFDQKYWQMMGLKIGIPNLSEKDRSLVENLRLWMEKNQADYTNTFLALESKDYPENSLYLDIEFLNWKKEWKSRLNELNISWEDVLKILKANNPSVIPRNHKVEEALIAASRDNDLTPLKRFLEILQKPYERENISTSYHLPQEGGDQNYKTFCGT
ncbi:protein adenylyltransferase SelO [Leptospira sp. GIMC2001]|uniref:protein adenylyltransferase SelO n=1 Tax=Leptospira sp. GIMC2001 TaxID=1513297 RepID=UPI0023492FE9|nr:YdiU family protein [Leptospira sp. GIMC2001]WCL47752.1 YdiU family protein [Leptospira sp. GIMC2001]